MTYFLLDCTMLCYVHAKINLYLCEFELWILQSISEVFYHSISALQASVSYS